MTASSLARLPGRRGFTSLLLALLAAGCIGDTSVSEQDALGEQLESMPYLTWVSAGDLEKSGVVQIDRDRASPGLNLYSPRNRPQAILMDLDGEIVHSWRAVVERGDTWQHVELLPNGDLLVVVAERRLLKVDANSKVVWTLDGQFHHDLAVSEVGRIYSILRGERSVDIDGEEVSILDDSIAVISPDGELLETVSIYDLFSDQVPASRWEHVKRWLSRSDTIEAANKRREKGELPFLHGSPVDLFHVNTVEIIPRDVDGVARKGDLLISLRELDQIAVLDLQTRAIRWRWGPGILRSTIREPDLARTVVTEDVDSLETGNRRAAVDVTPSNRTASLVRSLGLVVLGYRESVLILLSAPIGVERVIAFVAAPTEI